MKKLTVEFCGWGERWPLGTLADVGQGPVFEYSAEALTRGIEWSPLHAPLRAQGYSGFGAHQRGLPGFIDDALPDGWGMLLMDRIFRKHGLAPASLSPLDRLSFIGDRALGALAFLPAATMSLDDRSATLLELGRAAAAVGPDIDLATLKTLALIGGSPQGARPKALVQFDPPSGQVSTDASATGEPWLVKFPAQGEHREVCAMEFAYAQAARDCGIDMPPVHLFDLGRSMSAFGIARFDREAGMRVPVQSVAAALHADFRLPSLDYQTLLRVTRFFTRDEQEVRKAFARCVFNVAFHNRDDHAKNFAFRMDRRFGWKLAPAYDLSFSDGPRGWHQMAVMGEAREPSRPDLERLAKDAGVPAKIVAACIGRTREAAARVGPLLTQLGVRRATCKRVVSAIARIDAGLA